MIARMLLVLVLSATTLSAQSPSRAQIDAILNKAKADIDALFVTTPQTTTVPLGASLQTAIVKAGVGSTLVLSAGYATSEPIAIAKSLTIQGSGAVLKGGLVVTGSNVSIAGVTVTKQQARDDVVILTSDHITLTDFFVRGDPVRGQKRGILGNASNLKGTRVDVRDIWTARGLQDADIDSQAFACWDGCQDVEFVDSFFSGGTETFLVGGADAVSQLRQPARITLTHVTLTRPITQRDNPNVLVKNTLELKNVNTFTFQDGTIENAWAQGQVGYAIMLTPRNQDGNNPWASVEHVTIQRSKIQHAAALVSLLGTDDEKPSGQLRDVKILVNTYDDIDPNVWHVTGVDASSQFIQVLRGPQSVTIDGNKPGPIGARNIGSSVYFADLPKASDFNLTNNVLPKSAFGIFGADSAVGAAWAQWVVSGVLANNTEQ